MNELSNSSDAKKLVAQGYDLVADAYAQLENEAPWPRMRWLKKLLYRLSPGSVVLDLGCGSGDPADVEIIGVSDRYRTFTGFDIHPVLAVVPPDLPLVPHEAEVDSLFEAPLDFLLSPDNRARKELEFQGAIHHYYEIFWEENRIWGVTAAIVANLSKRLGYDNG